MEKVFPVSSKLMDKTKEDLIAMIVSQGGATESFYRQPLSSSQPQRVSQTSSTPLGSIFSPETSLFETFKVL